MYYNKMQKREKVKRSNKWFDTKEEIEAQDLPEVYSNLENEVQNVLDMWIKAYLKTSESKYMGYDVMEKRLPVFTLVFLFFKHTGMEISSGGLKGALMTNGFNSSDGDYNNNCVFNIAPSCYKRLQDFSVKAGLV